jgi:hypothetical protein
LDVWRSVPRVQSDETKYERPEVASFSANSPPEKAARAATTDRLRRGATCSVAPPGRG